MELTQVIISFKIIELYIQNSWNDSHFKASTGVTGPLCQPSNIFDVSSHNNENKDYGSEQSLNRTTLVETELDENSVECQPECLKTKLKANVRSGILGESSFEYLYNITDGEIDIK